MNIFEIATRTNVTFDTKKGQLIIQDIWNLPLKSETGKENLNDLAKSLHKQLKDAEELDFVTTTKNKANDLLQLKFDLVKHIIDTKLAENAAIASQRAKAAEKQELLELLNEKEKEEKKGLSKQELLDKIASLKD